MTSKTKYHKTNNKTLPDATYLAYFLCTKYRTFLVLLLEASYYMKHQQTLIRQQTKEVKLKKTIS